MQCSSTRVAMPRPRGPVPPSGRSALPVWLLLLAMAGCGDTVGTAADPAPMPADVATAPAPAGPSESALALVARPTAENPAALAVELRYTRGETRPGARMAEVRVEYDPAVLAFTGSDAGESASAAGKRLVVQDEGDALRVLVFATTNTARLDSGLLATLAFARRTGARTALTLRPERPLLAPPEADAGLVLGAPLVLDAEEGGR